MLDLSDLDYSLPIELLAEKPADKRGDSRLLTINRKTHTMTDLHFSDIADWFAPGDCLTLNDTRVLKARILAKRKSGGATELLLIERTDKTQWKAMMKNSRKIKTGETLTVVDPNGAPVLNISAGEVCENDLRMIRFEREVGYDEIDRFGITPIPPYIVKKRKELDLPPFWKEDDDWYQSVFAQKYGSVAAPTASLHFTREMLEKLETKGVRTAYVTLHVGPGTFLPIEGSIESFRIHREWIDVPDDTLHIIEETRDNNGRVVAVGTTVCRSLETAAMHSSETKLTAYSGYTELFIKPPFKFRSVDALITNFHMPKSTLLLLVYAFGGTELLKDAYRHAIEEKYRFYSYGDAMLIF